MTLSIPSDTLHEFARALSRDGYTCSARPADKFSGLTLVRATRSPDTRRRVESERHLRQSCADLMRLLTWRTHS